MIAVDDRAYLQPPNNEAKAVYECYYCQGTIYAGEECYKVEKEIYCEDCMENEFKIIATSEDIENLYL